MNDVIGDRIAVLERCIPVQESHRRPQVAEAEVARLRWQDVELGQDAVGDGRKVLDTTAMEFALNLVSVKIV